MTGFKLKIDKRTNHRMSKHFNQPIKEINKEFKEFMYQNNISEENLKNISVNNQNNLSKK